MPIWFGPSPASGVHYSSVILEVTPDEFQKIQNQELKLPDGWKVGDLFPKPTRGDRAHGQRTGAFT